MSSPYPNTEFWCFLQPRLSVSLCGTCPFGGLGLLAESLVGPDGAACSHENSISVISRGVERVVCEDCGDSIARYSSAVAGDVKRSQFARPLGFLHKLIELADESAENS